MSRLGCGWRVAVITTTSSCATAQAGAMASSMAATLLPFLMGDRLHAMKHFLLAVLPRGDRLLGAAARLEEARRPQPLVQTGHALARTPTGQDTPVPPRPQ